MLTFKAFIETFPVSREPTPFVYREGNNLELRGLIQAPSEHHDITRGMRWFAKNVCCEHDWEVSMGVLFGDKTETCSKCGATCVRRFVPGKGRFEIEEYEAPHVGE